MPKLTTLQVAYLIALVVVAAFAGFVYVEHRALDSDVAELQAADGSVTTVETLDRVYQRARAGWYHLYTTGVVGTTTPIIQALGAVGNHIAWNQTHAQADVQALMASPAAADDLPLQGLTVSENVAFHNYSTASGLTTVDEAFTQELVNPAAGATTRFTASGQVPVGVRAERAMTAHFAASVSLSLASTQDVWVALLKYVPNGEAFDYTLVSPPHMHRFTPGQEYTTLALQGTCGLQAGEGVLVAFGCGTANAQPGIHALSLFARQLSAGEIVAPL